MNEIAEFYSNDNSTNGNGIKLTKQISSLEKEISQLEEKWDKLAENI
jgi:hypothetical protein